MRKLFASLLLTSFALATVSTLAFAAAPATKPVIKPPPPDYFPLRLKDWWKYQSTTGEGKVTQFDVKVTGAEKQPDESIIWSVDTNSTKVIHDWYKKPAGLVTRVKEQFGEEPSMIVEYQPVYQFIKNPLVKDDAWTWNGTGMMGVSVADDAHVSGPEEIYVPAGKFSCMKVITQVKQGGGEVTKTYWFANHIGLIKSATQSGPVGSVTELLDWSFKPKPKAQ